MGLFFRNNYDLYNFIKENPSISSKCLRDSILLASGKDFEQDIKEFCISIGEHKKFEFAENDLRPIMELISQNINVV